MKDKSEKPKDTQVATKDKKAADLKVKTNVKGGGRLIWAT